MNSLPTEQAENLREIWSVRGTCDGWEMDRVKF